MIRPMKTTALLALTLCACSSLDPNVGPPYVEPPSTGEAGVTSDGGESDGEEDVDPAGVVFWRDIRPLMERGAMDTPKGCKGCHYSTEARHVGTDLSGLDVATLGALRRGGGSSGTRIIVPGKPDESALVQALRGTYGYANRMPKGGTSGYWTTEEVQKVADWISQGARGRSDE